MWSDQETDQDCLGFAANVEVLADFCTSQNLSPLTLGVFGHWGSGKTSLMKMIQNRIAAVNDSKQVLTLWFNAWRYEGREEAQSALIHAIIAKLQEKQTLGDEFKELADQVRKGASVMKLAKFITKSAVTLAPDVGSFLDCFSGESQKLADTMESFDADFAKLLERVGIRCVVVFIDDLDRCSSEKVVETFEAIKLFLNTPRCTFVIGADPERIEAAVGDVYNAGETARRDYLEKIVHLPFQIPQQDLTDIECYVGMLVLMPRLGKALWEELLDDRPKIRKAATPPLDTLKAWLTERQQQLENGPFQEAVSDLERVLPQTPTLARGLRGNPRQIKRFLNILALRGNLAKANSLKVDHPLLVKLAVLEYTWKDFFESLVESVDPGTGRSEFLADLVEKDIDELRTTKDSSLLANTAKQFGLMCFLRADPPFPNDLVLTPYLFLAQTSFESVTRVDLVGTDEIVRKLIGRIASDDRVRSLAAARQVVAKDAIIVGDILRGLATEFVAKDEVAARTHIVVALEEICRTHTQFYPAAVAVLQNYHGTASDALSLAASGLIGGAESHIEVSADLRGRYTTELTRALSGKRSAARFRKRT